MSPMDSTMVPPNLGEIRGKVSHGTAGIIGSICQKNSHGTPVESSGIQWTPVDSHGNRGGSVKSSTRRSLGASGGWGRGFVVVVIKLAWPDPWAFTPAAFASDDDDGGRMVVVEREVVVGRHV